MAGVLDSILRRIFRRQEFEVEKALLLLGRMESRRVKTGDVSSITEAEFKIFSQHGEDGIIQYLISRTDIKNRIFVEFGVESYREANTRFLLMNDNWSGLIMDCNSDHIKYLNKESYLGGNHRLAARSVFITAENINQVLAGEGISGSIGLLSVDIDSNDYWVLKALDMEKTAPDIIIVEYNGIWGPDRKVSIPYNKSGVNRFMPSGAGTYYGASIAAFEHLLKPRGYVFAGCDSSGVNGFFVRRESARGIKEISADKGYVAAKMYNSGKDKKGMFTETGDYHLFLNELKDMPLQDVESGEIKKVGDFFNL